MKRTKMHTELLPRENLRSMQAHKIINMLFTFISKLIKKTKYNSFFTMHSNTVFAEINPFSYGFFRILQLLVIWLACKTKKKKWKRGKSGQVLMQAVFWKARKDITHEESIKHTSQRPAKKCKKISAEKRRKEMKGNTL